MSQPYITVAFAGNPNAGKTTLFNAVTGLRQHVGNYPGVTVEKKEGLAHSGANVLHVVDLPGTYSLTPYSTDEIVARNFIMDHRPDVIVDIVDSSNLERNLYLATQIVELGVPLVLAFNMADVAHARGLRIHTRKLSQLLGVPIVRTIGHKGAGVDKLLAEVVALNARAGDAARTQQQVDYGSEIEPHVRQLTDFLSRQCGVERHARWYALRLLEDDGETVSRLRKLCPLHVDAAAAEAQRLRKHIEGVFGESCEIVLADRRYGFIAGACKEAVTRVSAGRRQVSDSIDRVLTNRYLGLPIFGVLMYLVFQLTFSLGNPIVNFLDAVKERAADAVRNWAAASGATLLGSLLADGVIEGVGAVLSFVPLIVLLYLAITILEDSGYMARAAFLLDRMMHRIGLHGKSFIPMLIGFGCTVPAVMATRVLESRRDRMTTILVLPLMSCGARLTVFVLLLGAFFPSRVVAGVLPMGADALGHTVYLLAITNQALLLLGLYALGIVLAIACTRLLRASIFRGPVMPLVMELPPYHMPAARGLLIHLWERAWMYVKKAGTVILAIVIVLWALKTWPALPSGELAAFQQQRKDARSDALAARADPGPTLLAIDRLRHRRELSCSAIGRFGNFIAPALQPCGFDWRISTALLGSVAAREVFIGQMGVIYAVGEDEEAGASSLRQRLAAEYTPLQGLCIMIFILIASPCLPTLAVTARESGSWKWALLQWSYLTALAWVITAGAYQFGRWIM